MQRFVHPGPPRASGSSTGFRTHPDHCRGSVLIAVLGIIVLLSFLVSRFVEEAVDDLEYRALFAQPPHLRAYAYSMLEVALANVQEVGLIDDGKLHAPEQGWSDPMHYAGIEAPNGWEVEITIRDAGGRLPINTMDKAALNHLLENGLDLNFALARELSASLLDWIDRDENRRLNGAESETYLRRNPPHRAANRPLQSLDELRLVKGWDEAFFDEQGTPNERFEELNRLVTVLHQGPVNLNAAPKEVLDLLALRDGWQADYLFDGLDKPYLTATPASAGGGGVGTEVQLLEITVRLRRGDVPFVLSALVEPVFDGTSGSSRSAGGSPGGSPGGRAADTEQKTGTLDEQEALNYPFRILRISEHESHQRSPEPGRHSALNIDKES
ncbi:MAG: general secretion pathway protein GspK [Opitutales bacterium]